jgi:hypothetical protein
MSLESRGVVEKAIAVDAKALALSFLLLLLLQVYLVAVVGFVVFQLNHGVDLGPAELVEVVPAGLIAPGQGIYHRQRVPLGTELAYVGGALSAGLRDALEVGGVGASYPVVIGKKKSVRGKASRSFTAPQSTSTTGTRSVS